MAALSGVALMRVQKELKMLYEEPPPGISAWASNDSNISELDAGA
jgi:ubiquitin-protein ligase